MPIWTDAVRNAIRRHVARTGSPLFTRRELIAAEIDAIRLETGTVGRTPTQTLGRELQQLRDAGAIAFLARGTYRWLGDVPDAPSMPPGKGVFVAGLHPTGDERLEQLFRFPRELLREASRVVDDWIVYQGSGGTGVPCYQAVAKVDRIDPDPAGGAMYVARIATGTYLEFGRDVALTQDGEIIERGLVGARGRLDEHRAARSVRPISEGEFNRIVDLGLLQEDELLPRVDDEPPPSQLAEERVAWDGPVDRATMLVNRTVRDRQFRARVLAVYGSRCALTGMKLINGGGRAETQAAHIMSVESGGPDAVTNGIALSGTIHWMFDRGLISLSDGGDILLSRAINDVDSVERLIYPDRKARFPKAAADRPHPRYLGWHRTECFHD